VSGAGDVNGDGYDDLIVGAYRDDPNDLSDAGSASVFSGQNGSLLHTFEGDSSTDYFGYSVSGAGDVNGDGYDDLIVGAYQDDPNDLSDAGSASVFSGLDGALLHTFEGDSSSDHFGHSVSGAGDVNGDGYADLIVGAHQDDPNGLSDAGSASVFSGQNGSLLHKFEGDSSSDHFGHSVSDAGDVNNDGLADLIVGAYGDAPNGANSGSASLFSGQDGSLLHKFKGDSSYDYFGVSVSGAGDVNGDGFVDLIVGAYQDDPNGGNSGSASLFSGQDGSLLHKFEGDSGSDHFGVSVSGAGDVNGDGLADLIVGAYRDDPNGTDSGSAKVLHFVPSIGNVHSFVGDSILDYFGISVSDAGDVNNDGFADLIVGAYKDDPNGTDSGSASVFSGLNGALLHRFEGDSSDDRFGRSVSGAGDANGDGFADLIVGAYQDDPNGTDSGSASLFSGLNGALLHKFEGDSSDDCFGFSVSGAGDVNGDGYDDLIVGAYQDGPNGGNSGSASLFSGQDGSLLHTFEGDAGGDRFGYSVSGAGDVNGDGYADLIVGAYGDDPNGSSSGSASVFSGLDGGLLHTFEGDSRSDYFGWSVSGAGDVNGDGFSDLIVGARGDDNNGTDSGSASVFSGLNGALLHRFEGDSGSDYFGGSVSGAGDVNGDGFDELIVGAHGDDPNGTDSGSASVLFILPTTWPSIAPPALPPEPVKPVSPVKPIEPIEPIIPVEPVVPVAPNPPIEPVWNFWPDELTAPRIVVQSVAVGERISAPDQEFGAVSNYWAGYINREIGTLYDPNAYSDPLANGFAAANRGAIIPVNAIPGQNELEVWWFRENASRAGFQAGDDARGFATIYWPSVIGRYTIHWPTEPREIVLASQLGGENLSSLEANGAIYTQNDPERVGYNPNEEHAVMSGGTPFATRDDLNITNGANYSSAPYVLVEYTEADGRPAITPFKVLREKSEAGYVFDYVVPAGQLLQPPPPLTFLAKPVEGSGDNVINYNTEPTDQLGDLPVNWNETLHTNDFAHYKGFTYRDRKEDFWVYRGLHSGIPALQAGTYAPQTDTFLPLSSAVAMKYHPFRFTLHASRQDEFLTLTSTNLPDWLAIDHLSLVGTPGADEVGSENIITLVVEDNYDHVKVTNTLSLFVLVSGSPDTQSGLVFSSTNSYTGTVVAHTDRPPFLGFSPNSSNSFTMQYYYKTEESFAWPGLDHPPATGTVVPYLRPVGTNGQFIGNADSKTNALQIVYRPTWPGDVPALPFGATLTEPAYELPGVRDWMTARIFYQQSIAADMGKTHSSAVLHDPTVFKLSDLAAQGLEDLPAGVKSELHLGKVYFPGLPPHLEKRLYLDPNRGEAGSLVLKGEYKQETLGENYIQLNVLRGSDLQAAHDLCPASDADYSRWVAAIDALAVDVETFYEDPTQPGTYIPNPALTQSVGVGDVVEITSDNSPRDSYAVSATGPGSGYVTLLENSGVAFTEPGDPVALHVFKVGGDSMVRGELKMVPAENPLSELLTFQHTADLAGRTDEFEYEWKIAAPVDGFPPEVDATMSRYLALTSGSDLPRHTLGGAGIQALGDNYVVMRYRPTSADHPLHNQWSEWTVPALAEGWIKRVLAGINPFNQRLTDLFNNAVNTDVSLLTQAGPRWEGDIALNLDTINNYGLIEIYETVLRRGRKLSIDDVYNYGPANDALLLAAGYLNDLYMMFGNEAWADAANPTIGIGTDNIDYGDIATALFSFKGQQASLLDEELALLRGRDDVFQPGVEVRPVYNRLIWNYTRGIDAGEVIYALNYNVQENPNQEPDGIINAEDAALMYPQGHGDGYGHYLTALKGYYSLLMNSNFDWVPRIEAVNVLGKPVSVDYQDERKFSAAAAAVARAGRQVFDLTWRKDYQAVGRSGWGAFAKSRVNSQRTYLSPGSVTNHPVRYWGMDGWASRTGQGTYIHWLVGNSMLPAVDPNPNHEGIQKVDRTTVPELTELPTLLDGLQTAMEHAEAGLAPLGVPEGAIALDIDPTLVGLNEKTHFEQIYDRATVALNNAVVSFDDAKDVTKLMRSEENSLNELQNQVAEQELAYRNALIELYGTAYPDDMGPGKTWVQDYAGPDTLHYMYVETPELPFRELWNYPGNTSSGGVFKIFLADLPSDWGTKYDYTLLEVVNNPNYSDANRFIEIEIGPHGYFEKPESWTRRRASPGRIQQAISEEIDAYNKLFEALYNHPSTKGPLDRLIGVSLKNIETDESIRNTRRELLVSEEALEKAQFANELVQRFLDSLAKEAQETGDEITEAIPKNLIFGLSNGGDVTSPARAAAKAVVKGVTLALNKYSLIRQAIFDVMEMAQSSYSRWTEHSIEGLEWERDQRSALIEIEEAFADLDAQLWGINELLRAYEDAQREVRSLIAEGDRIQEEREVVRKRTSALVQGYRTRDAAFRIFRNEKLERYKTLFDLAARYSLLAANVYDYETGLLGTDAGQSFIQRIIQARALGVVADGEPQFAGSNTGDPGLSSALAEMKADWDVVRTRLGFNNSDDYSTVFSLRTENYRILPDETGDANWKTILHQARKRDLLEDADVRRYCMQISQGDGLPVPGIILNFRTTITSGYNLFGKSLSAYDHAYSPKSFATKIYSVGIALVGYQGMSDPYASGSLGSTEDPDLSFLDPDALAANPYIYLIPVGVDSMRSPPLGDASGIRSWMVDDLAIPMPFNIGASEFSTQPLYQSNDSLTEPLFAIRKHQPFRPVSDPSAFELALAPYGDGLVRSPFTSSRLIGRSVWNSEWKLVIPGDTLLKDPYEGLDRLIQTLKDIKIYFGTYSYSGN